MLNILQKLGTGDPTGMSGAATAEYLRQGAEMGRSKRLMDAMMAEKYRECHPGFVPPEEDDEMPVVNVSGNVIAGADELEKIIRSIDDQPQPQPCPPQQPSPPRRSWVPWLLLAGAFLVGAGLISWTLFESLSPPLYSWEFLD